MNPKLTPERLLKRAIVCLEASRLARNGREWHHLIELCGLLGAVLADPDGVYDPALINDRLLLGLRGTMSEFELNLIPATFNGGDSPEGRPWRVADPTSGWLLTRP